MRSLTTAFGFLILATLILSGSGARGFPKFLGLYLDAAIRGHLQSGYHRHNARFVLWRMDECHWGRSNDHLRRKRLCSGWLWDSTCRVFWCSQLQCPCWRQLLRPGRRR